MGKKNKDKQFSPQRLAILIIVFCAICFCLYKYRNKIMNIKIDTSSIGSKIKRDKENNNSEKSNMFS